MGPIWGVLLAPGHFNLERPTSPPGTHSGGGGGVHVDHAAHVGPHGVDGGVGAEAGLVDAQVGGALLHNITQDVHLHLGTEERVEEGPRRGGMPCVPPMNDSEQHVQSNTQNRHVFRNTELGQASNY